ncbi:putative ABC transporter ATP-binding protein [Actinacidiphila reveromycinica]|uniref:Putative ABC transporter ATP-binding protein n=1 Tax=Actinacidiphila reveromycinica TaxID=659352 RepID=A0A7U3VMS6_9ACTN|nr:ABC transporter ATP-binding protein [Streptomyces sp. SN-593]BBA96898.1 putative ABC transporter ATP-binding protein [Streptomyces sp. SN-593]
MRRNGASRQDAPQGGHLLVAEELVKSHRVNGAAVKAVRGIDLVVETGEFVAVTGPSGAGKSTLLHLLGGLQRPDSGRILLGGRRVDQLSEARWAALRRRRVGIVFQFFNLVSTLTVADNVELPGLLAGRPGRDVRSERAGLLDELGLTGKEDSTPSDLSGGQQQRVALARALINRPNLLLADEPTGSLDSRGTREVLGLLSRCHQRGQTIVLVTHDAGVASAADRVVSLFDGRVADDVRFPDPPTRPGAVSAVVRLTG